MLFVRLRNAGRHAEADVRFDNAVDRGRGSRAHGTEDFARRVWPAQPVAKLRE